MGNTYNHEHYVAFRDSQHNPIRRGDKTGDAKLEPMVQWGGWIPAEKVNRIAAISANYVSKMDGYYQELYSRLPKSVLMWTVEEVACWLGVIGMGSQQGKFRQLGIDGSSVFLLQMVDLWEEIGIKSAMSLGIFQAWIQVGFMEYEKYVNKKQSDFRKQQKDRMGKMLTSVNRRQISFAGKQTKNQSIRLSHKNQKQSNSIGVTNTFRSKPQSVRAAKALPMPCDFETKLQVLDKKSNICLGMENFPMGIIGEFQQIYKELGITASKSGIERQDCKLFSLRRQIKRPVSNRQSNLLRQKSRRSFNFHKQGQIEDIYQLIVGKRVNSNNIPEYRLSLMADLNNQGTKTQKYDYSTNYDDRTEGESSDDVENQINAYVEINQPCLIPQVGGGKGRDSGYDLNSRWKFMGGDYVFEPSFIHGQQSEVVLCLHVLGLGVTLTVDPYRSLMDKDCQNSVSFFIYQHPRKTNLQVCQPQPSTPLQQWFHEMQQLNYEQIATIVYVRSERLYYLCKIGEVESFCRSKAKEDVGYGHTCRKSSKKKLQRQQEEDGSRVEKSLGRKQKKKQKQQHSQPDEGPADEKYHNSRDQYSISLSRQSNKCRVWVKMGIHPFSDKLTLQNSIKVSRGTSLRLGTRQYVFNIATILKPHSQSKSKPVDEQTEAFDQHIRSMMQSTFDNPHNHSHNHNHNSSIEPMSKHKELTKGKTKTGDSASSGGNRCIICLQRYSDCIYMDCGHNVTCIRCGKNVDRCPVCRNPIADYVRVYPQ